MKKCYNTEFFINKAKKIHDNKYNYSLTEYVNSKTKIKIICSKHGIFEQTPNAHLSKKGCSKCSNYNFIEKAKKIHDDKYNYSLTEYVNSKTPIKIICSKHGIFEQTPNVHLNGSGCQKCGKYSNINKFIEKAKLIHSNKYDYSLVEYIDNKTPIKIICKIHGIFEQKPNHHLLKCGCTKCAIDKSKLTKEQFILDSIKKHGNKYDYSLVEYNGIFKKIKIICPEHGIFEQSPDNHKQGKGCPICNESYGEKEIRILLKNNNINYIRQHKFADCCYKRKLPFDFYLPEYNICIEYDGIQHFNVVDYWGGQKEFEKQKIKDEIKNMFCLQNNIILVRITYNDNIISIIENILNKKLYRIKI